MALSEDQLAEVLLEITRLDTAHGSVYFNGNIPATAEEMKTHVLSTEGQKEALAFTKAFVENKDFMADIPNMAEFIQELVHPALENRSAVKPKAAKLVAAKLQRSDSREDLLAQQDLKAAELEASKAKYEADKKEAADLWWKQRGEDLNELSDNFQKMSLEISNGATRTASIAAGGFMQFAANFKKLATHSFNFAARKFEDAPEVANKMKESLMDGISSALKAAKEFMHEVKKILDPSRQLHHMMQKQIPEMMQNQLDQAEVNRLALADKVQARKISELRKDGNEVAAALIEKSLTPTERAANKKVAEAAAVKLAAETKEAEEKHNAMEKKLNEELKAEAKSKKRSNEDKAVSDQADGVYKQVKDQVVNKLRGRASSASEVKGSKVPDSTTVRKRPDSSQRIV